MISIFIVCKQVSQILWYPSSDKNSRRVLTGYKLPGSPGIIRKVNSFDYIVDKMNV